MTRLHKRSLSKIAMDSWKFEPPRGDFEEYLIVARMLNEGCPNVQPIALDISGQTGVPAVRRNEMAKSSQFAETPRLPS